MIRTVIVDDEIYIRGELRYFLDQIDNVEIVGETGDGDEVLAIIEREKPDLLFLDIELGHANGLTLARRIMQMWEPPKIILSTAYDKYAVMGFELSVSDYILKPFSLERIRSAVNKAMGCIKNDSLRKAYDNSGMDKIAASKNGRIYLVDTSDIIHFQAKGNGAALVAKDGTYEISSTLKEIEESFQSGKFIRIHKSNIVNVDFIEEIIPWFNYTCKLRLRGSDDELTVSRNYFKSFN